MFDIYNPIDLMRYPTEVNENISPEKMLERAVKNTLYGCCTYAVGFVIVLLLCIFLGSCTTIRTVTVERITHDTLNVTQHQRDSIYLHDSIYVRERTKGDTVFLDVIRWRTEYRDRWLHDSIFATRVDSIPVPYPVEKPVPRPLSWFQQMQIWLGRMVLVALAVLAGWFILHWWLRLKKITK